RESATGEPVLPEHRCDAGWLAGLVHAQGHGSNSGIQRQATFFTTQDPSYVPNAVPEGAGTNGLKPLGVAGQAAHFTMAPSGRPANAGAEAPTSVTLFDQGLVQVLQASVTGLKPKHPYVLALSNRADG